MTFTSRFLALTSAALLCACSAQQASVSDPFKDMENYQAASSAMSGGPYLEFDDEPADSVELTVDSSGSTSVQ